MKKIIAILLSGILLACPFVIASADTTTKTDDFQSATVGPVDITKATAYSSDVWHMNNTKSAYLCTHSLSLTNYFIYNAVATDPTINMTIVEETDGNRYMELEHISNRYVAVAMQNTPNAEDTTVFAMFKFRVPQTVGATSAWAFAVKQDNNEYGSKGILSINPNGKIYTLGGSANNADQGEGVPYDTDTWYTAVYEMTKTQAKVYIYGDEGVLTESSVTINSNNATPVLRIYGSAGETQTGAAIHIDDAKIFTTSSSSSSITSSSIEDGADKVTRKPALELGLNGIITDLSNIGITITDSESNVVPQAQYSISQLDIMTVKVQLNSLLERGETYTVSVTVAGSPAGSVSFTTEETHVLSADDNALTLDKLNDLGEVTETDISSLSAGKVKVNLTVSDPLEYPVVSGNLMVVLYDENGCLSWFDFAQTDAATTMGTATLSASFTLPTIPANAKLCVLLFDPVLNFMPICDPIGF